MEKTKIDFSKEELAEIQNLLEREKKRIKNEQTNLMNRNKAMEIKEKQINIFNDLILKIDKEINPQCQI